MSGAGIQSELESKIYAAWRRTIWGRDFSSDLHAAAICLTNGVIAAN